MAMIASLSKFRSRANFFRQVVTRDSGHGDVEQKNVWLEGIELREALGAVDRYVDLMALELKPHARRSGGVGVVVDDEDTGERAILGSLTGWH